MVACGNDMQPGNGMDELSVTGKTLLIEFFNGIEIRSSFIRKIWGFLACPFRK